MKRFLLTLLISLCAAATTIAGTQPAMIFTQDVIAINSDGSRLPQVRIDPKQIPEMQHHDFDLGRDRLLRVQTNIVNAEERGLSDLVATVKRCYSYVEEATGQKLERGVLLYLVEMDVIPQAYTFSASYNDPSQWGEVHLALLDRTMPLSGHSTPASISNLLYDTLPHELGHDAIEMIPQLLHDIDGDLSRHTRWFIEGACEVLAKGFSQREAPDIHRRYLALRKVDKVLADRKMHTELLSWAQENNNSMVQESDLYGAAMLTVMEWTKSISLRTLLERLTLSKQSIRGTDLIVMMQATTGIGAEEMFNRAHAHGQKLNQGILLAQLEIN